MAKIARNLSIINVHDYGKVGKDETYSAYPEIFVDPETFAWHARIYSRKETEVAQGLVEVPERRFKDATGKEIVVPAHAVAQRIGKVLAEESGKADSYDNARHDSQAWVYEQMKAHRIAKTPSTLHSYAIPLPIDYLPSWRDVKRVLRRYLTPILRPVILMALAYSATIRNNRLNQIRDAIDGGAGAGLIRIYDGTRPATGGTATTLGAELTCSDPCAAAASGGVLTFSAITADSSANASITASWFRIVDSAATFCVDGNVGTSGSDLNLNSTTITSGQEVSITSGTITEGNP